MQDFALLLIIGAEIVVLLWLATQIMEDKDEEEDEE